MTSTRIVLTLVLACIFSGCTPYGCWAIFESPTVEAQDLRMFQAGLAKNPAFAGLQATAVHGHDVDVTDEAFAAHSLRYNVEPGISDNLSRLWLGIIERNHPSEFNKNVTTVWIFDEKGRKVFGISSGNCQTL